MIEDTKNDLLKNIEDITEISYKILCEKISHKNIKVENEATLQLHFGYILNTLGKLYEFSDKDKFFIDLETNFLLEEKSEKSNSKRARCDIFMKMQNDKIKKECAIELKFYKKENHREPNNRYDLFADLHNLENYKKNGVDLCYMIIGTDHSHYVDKEKYSEDTKDFDFRDGKKYEKGTKLTYATEKPYGNPIKLSNDYCFKWTKLNDYYFMIIKV